MLHALQVPQTYAIVAQLSVCLPNAVISCMTCCPAKLIFIPNDAPQNCAHGDAGSNEILSAVTFAPPNLHRTCSRSLAGIVRCVEHSVACWFIYPFPEQSSAACAGGVHCLAQVEAGGAQRGLEVCQLVRRAVLQRRLIA